MHSFLISTDLLFDLQYYYSRELYENLFDAELPVVELGNFNFSSFRPVLDILVYSYLLVILI